MGGSKIKEGKLKYEDRAGLEGQVMTSWNRETTGEVTSCTVQ